MKKILAMILALAMIACLFAGCGGDTDTPAGDGDKKDVKVGVVLIGDENEGYTLAHINGIKEACKNLGLSETDNIVWKYAIPEDETCKTAIEDCIDQGCTLVFTNSYGHQDYAKTAAEQNPNVDIVAMTGDTAKKSNLSNFHNAFTKIYEARYVAGVVAGLKINQLKEEGKLTDKNMKDGKVKVGYLKLRIDGDRDHIVRQLAHDVEEEARRHDADALLADVGRNIDGDAGFEVEAGELNAETGAQQDALEARDRALRSDGASRHGDGGDEQRFFTGKLHIVPSLFFLI